MVFAEILVPLWNDAESAVALNLAAEIASYFHSHVEAVGTTFPSDQVERKATEFPSDAQARHLISVFESWRAHHKLELQPECVYRGLPSASLVLRSDELGGALRDRARFADLVCLAMTPKKANAREQIAVLFSTGRPILMSPVKEDVEFPQVIGEPIVIGWNGSAEAARAVTGALPFIKVSRHVDVISIGEESVNAFDAYELAKYLAWWGVRAVATGIRIEDWTGGDVVDAAVARRAKLLVMGAREKGSVTSHVLEGLPI
jgi:hypothetical protein